MIEQKMKSVIERISALEHELGDPSLINAPERYTRLTREHAALAPLAHMARERSRLVSELAGLAELAAGQEPELVRMAVHEREMIDSRLKALDQDLTVLLLPPDPLDGRDIIVEIRAGTGGDEAALFAGDLLRMYVRYAERRGWPVELYESHETGLGGYKEVSFGLSGPAVWRAFKYERGIHRVQRVPETEASGRIHTSAVTVAVLPVAEEVDIQIRTEDLRIDTYRASGAGGQHINKTDSAIRITHLPTGLVVACQDERSQMKNRAKAMKLLGARLLDSQREQQAASLSTERKRQVGSGDRSEKVRTYNFPQNRITDHRIDVSVYRLREMLEGDLDELLAKLAAAEREEQLARLASEGA